jgi:hypothetical protein
LIRVEKRKVLVRNSIAPMMLFSGLKHTDKPVHIL